LILTVSPRLIAIDFYSLISPYFKKNLIFCIPEGIMINRVCPVYLMPNFTSFPLVVDDSPSFAITNLYIPRQQPVSILPFNKKGYRP